MWMQQTLVSAVCILLAAQQITAVVNTGTNTKSSVESISINDNNNSNIETKDTTAEKADSIAAAAATEAEKRETVIDLTGNFQSVGVLDSIYGAPIDSYLPVGGANIDLPIPVYGVPNVGPNIVYPAPPPDVPPPLPVQYGVPNGLNLHPKDIYGPPKDISFPPKFAYGPPKYKLPKIKYGPPQQRPPKPFNSPPFHPPKGPKPIYGPPRFQKPLYLKPKPFYGPPKPHYGPPKGQYGPPKQVHIPSKPIYIPSVPITGPILNPPPVSNSYGPPSPVSNSYGPPSGVSNSYDLPPPVSNSYGPPTITVQIIKDVQSHTTKHYGPPEPVPHGPPPGVPAPPTPPDIKYDGWQPIPGLVSKPPSGAYGVPHGQGGHGSFGIHGDFTPPAQQGSVGIHSLGLQDSYKGSADVSDSYGAPLNTVTGSGGVVATSGEAHHQQGHQQYNLDFNNQQEQHHEDHQTLSLGLQAVGLGGQDNALSVVKSVGYEIYPNHALGYAAGYPGNQGGDSYSVPPANSYSPDGPYPAAQGYKFSTNDLSNGFESVNAAFGSNEFGKELDLSLNVNGLIPPNGVYGVAPSTHYGTPLFQPAKQHFKGPPKHPVVFREPVPAGLIQSGNEDYHQEVHGIVETVGNHGNVYIPPPVPDLTKPVKEEVPEPTDLYSLPHINRPVSFQNVVHGSSTAGLSADIVDFNINAGHSSQQQFNQEHQQQFSQQQQQFSTSFSSEADHSSQFNYNQQQDQRDFSADVGSLGGAYALPLQSAPAPFNPEHTNNAALQINQFNNGGYDFNTISNGYHSNNFGYQHDCNSHGSQPLPQLSYGVPSGNGYTAALSSLHTNTDSGYHGQPALTYGTPDLTASHSQSTVKLSSANSFSEAAKEVYAKSFGESIAAGGEVVQSQSLDLNNIPLHGSLGSYTLQIQSADGAGGTESSSGHVPHEQVLNDGLLQSILAAIERPQNEGGSLMIQSNHQGYHQVEELQSRLDGDSQPSLKNAVIVLAPTVGVKVNKTESKAEANEETVDLIDDNEIALYFKNSDTKNDKEKVSNNTENKDVRSYVSFKTPNTSYNYNLKSTSKEESSGKE